MDLDNKIIIEELKKEVESLEEYISEKDEEIEYLENYIRMMENMLLLSSYGEDDE